MRLFGKYFLAFCVASAVAMIGGVSYSEKKEKERRMTNVFYELKKLEVQKERLADLQYQLELEKQLRKQQEEEKRK